MDDGRTETLTPQEFAAKLETAFLDPFLDGQSVVQRFRKASADGLSAVILRPSDIEACVRVATSPTTRIAALCGFPYGWQSTSVKAFEARDLMRRGANRIDVVLNVAKLASREFQFVETELIQLAQACHEKGAKLRAIFQTHWLGDEQKLVASKIAKRSETDEAIAALQPSPVADEDVLLRKCPPYVGVCTFARDLDGALKALERGFNTVVVPDPAQMLAQFQARLEPVKSAS